MHLDLWQLIVLFVLIFGFGYRLGWVHGEGQAWEDQDAREGENDGNAL